MVRDSRSWFGPSPITPDRQLERLGGPGIQACTCSGFDATLSGGEKEVFTVETSRRPGRFEKRRKVRVPRRILTVLNPAHGYRTEQGRIRCDGRWRRYLEVAVDDHEWLGTEGGTIVYERPDDPVELPTLTDEERRARFRLIRRIARAQARAKAEMLAWKATG
jgi:hypothetical protein